MGVATVAFAAVGSFAILTGLRAVMPMRLDVDAEMSGIDISEHGEAAYHGSDLSDLTGRSTMLGDAVMLPLHKLPSRSRSHVGA